MSRSKTSRNRPTPWPIDAHFFEQESLEVLDDARGRPLLVMPVDMAVQMRLPHKGVVVALQNMEKKVFVRRLPRNRSRNPGLWDLSVAGRVLRGEAREDTALRLLRSELGIKNVTLSLHTQEIAQTVGNGLEVSLYLSTPGPFYPSYTNGLFLDQEELEALIRDIPDQTTPALLWAAARIWRQHEK